MAHCTDSHNDRVLSNYDVADFSRQLGAGMPVRTYVLVVCGTGNCSLRDSSRRVDGHETPYSMPPIWRMGVRPTTGRRLHESHTVKRPSLYR